jgi:hypothetical protein
MANTQARPGAGILRFLDTPAASALDLQRAWLEQQSWQ